LLAKAVGTKSISQIKNFYYDYKKQGKHGPKSDKKTVKSVDIHKSKSLDDKDTRTEIGSESSSKKRAGPPLIPQLGSRKSKSSNPSSPSPPATTCSTVLTRQESSDNNSSEMIVSEAQLQQHLLQRQQELMQRHGYLQRQQELHDLQRQAELQTSDFHPQDTESRVEGTGSMTMTSAVPHNDLMESLLSGSSEYNSDLIQQLLNRQQGQQHDQNHNLNMQLQQQHQQQHHSSQSALQQLLSRQNHQRDQQHQQQQASQMTLEEARRLLEQQSQQQVLSNIFPGWSSAPHLFQTQSRMQQAQLAAALQQQDGASSIGNATISDLADVANIQRLLQMQQQQRSNPLLGLGRSNHSQLGSLLGLSSSAGTGISAGLLAQLEGLGSGRNGAHAPDQVPDSLSSILRQYSGQNSLGGNVSGGSSSMGGAASHLFHPGSSNAAGGLTGPSDGTPTVSDAFALLQRAMQRESANRHGFSSSDR
jgi:hypothetical protein